MRIHVVGVKRVSGVGKESGNPYDISRVFVLVPIEQGGGKMTVSGYGFEASEIDLDPSVLESFKTIKFPTDLDLTISQKFQFGSFKSVVTGFAEVVASAPVASVRRAG